MNKIYSLKYSHITGGLVAVSELTRKVSVGTSRKKVILGIILSSIYGSYGETAFAAMLDINNIWTRDYLDLAQNRGEFRPGATNVQLMMKDGKIGNDSNLLIVFYVQIMPDDLVMQLHRF